jgi:hypothetical protein
MFIKINNQLSGYVLISITSVILIIASIISSVLFYQKQNLININDHQEFRDLNEQLYALQKQTLNELEINILQVKHFNRNTVEEVMIEGENNFQHLISLRPLDGCLNLTALIYKDLDGRYRSRRLEKKRFQYIFQQLGFDTNWVNSLIDYQDSDFQSSFSIEEKEKEYKNLPFLHLSEVFAIIDLTPSQKKLFQEHFCVNQIDRKFNLQAMSPSQIVLLFPFLNSQNFKGYLANSDYQGFTSIKEWEQLLVQFLQRSLSPNEKEFLNSVSLENKTLEMLVRSSKKGLNWTTKIKFEMRNQNEVMVAYQLGPYIENE